MKNKSSLALTSTGKTGLTLKTYNGNDNQQFYFESNDAGESARNVDPVLVHGYSSKYKNHWAVITGYTGDGTKTSQFTVMDPSFSSTKTLQQFFDTFSDKKHLALVK